METAFRVGGRAEAADDSAAAAHQAGAAPAEDAEALVSGIGDSPSPQLSMNRRKTSNVQHRTSNAEGSENSRSHSMFEVGCSSGFMGIFQSLKIGTASGP